MSIVNIQRDATYINIDSARLDLSGESSVDSNSHGVNTTGTVHQDYASALVTYNTSFAISASNVRSFGVMLAAPKGDRAPYRIKARSDVGEGGSLLLIGYAPETIINNVVASQCVFLPFDREFDDLVIIEEDTGTYADRAIVFGLAIYGKASGLSAGRVLSSLSVQRLGVSPPTMQFAVS